MDIRTETLFYLTEFTKGFKVENYQLSKVYRTDIYLDCKSLNHTAYSYRLAFHLADLGFKIQIGDDFISFNLPDGSVCIDIDLTDIPEKTALKIFSGYVKGLKE